MTIKKLQTADFTGKGVSGLPDTPNLSAGEMQAKFDELAKDVLTPKINELIDGIAAEEADALFGGEDETDVREFFVAVEVILTPLIHRNDVAAESFFLLRFAFDLFDRRGASLLRFLVRRAVAGRRFDLFRNVDDLLERDEFQAGTFEFFFARRRVETVAHEVALFRREARDRRKTDVVVRHDEAVGGDERRAS